MKRQALARVGGIERHVGAAGLEDRRGAPTTSSSERSTAEADAALRPDAEPRAGGAPAGRRGASSSRVGERRRRRRRPRRRSGVRARLRREQLVQAVAGAGSPRAVSFHSPSELVALRRGEQRQVGRAGAPGRATAAASRVSKLRSRRCDRGRVEEVGVVLERAGEPVAVLDEEEGEVELGGAAGRPGRRPAARGRGRAPPLRRAGRSGARTSPGRAGCGQARAPAAAPRPAARTAGPGARRRRAPSRAPGRAARAKPGSPDEVGAQHQGVDEEADQPLDLAPACGWRSAMPTATSSCPV